MLETMPNMGFWRAGGKNANNPQYGIDEVTSHEGEAPSPWVGRFTRLIEPGSAVLDLACGTGRHVRHLLSSGYKVVGVDKYVAGIAGILGTPDFEFIEANLEDGSPWPLGDRKFDGIVVTNYLYRPLFPTLARALKDGGVLIYETFAEGNARYGHPRNPDFLLRPGELLDAFTDKLRVVAYEHGAVQSPRPAVIQRICAVNATGDTPHALPPGIGP